MRLADNLVPRISEFIREQKTCQAQSLCYDYFVSKSYIDPYPTLEEKRARTRAGEKVRSVASACMSLVSSGESWIRHSNCGWLAFDSENPSKWDLCDVYSADELRRRHE